MGLFSFLFASPEKLEEKGDACFGRGDFGTAKLRYEESLNLAKKKAPGNGEFQAKLHDKLIKSQEALANQHLENARQLAESGLTSDAADLLKLAMELTGNPELSATLENELEKVQPPEEEMEEPEFQDEDLEEPEEVYEDQVSDDDEFMLITGTLPEPACEEYRSYGKLFMQGFLALSRGDFETAAQTLEKSLEDQEKKDTFIPLELATALVHLGKGADAEAYLAGFLAARPGSVRGTTLMCDLLCEQKRFGEAHRVLENAPKELQNSLAGLLNLGRILFLEKKFDRAEALYRDFLANNEWNEDVARAYSIVLETTGKLDEARDLIAGILNQCTQCRRYSDPMDRKRYADISLELGDHSEKNLEIYLNLALEEPVIAAECYNKAAAIYKMQGNEQEASRFEQMAQSL